MRNKTASRARAGKKTSKPIASRSKKVKSELDTATSVASNPVERPRVTFESLATETDPLVIKQGLLRTLDQLYEDCVNKVRVNRAGVAYPDPDSSGAAKATDLSARILGAIGVDPVVMIQFKNDTEKLVQRAAAVLRERETKNLPAKDPEE